MLELLMINALEARYRSAYSVPPARRALVYEPFGQAV